MISLKEKSMADPLLKVDHVTISYNGEPTVQDVSFELKQGEILGIVGESGSGKSTIGKAILRYHKPTGGEIFYEGTEIGAMGEKELLPYRKKMQSVFHRKPDCIFVCFIDGDTIMNYNIRDVRNYVMNLRSFTHL